MTIEKLKIIRRQRRHQRVCAKVKGNAKKLRLSVFRSNKNIYAQAINDQTGQTLAQANDGLLKKNKAASKKIKSKVDSAKYIGKLLGEQILKQGYHSIVFDRGGYKYHGRVKALAEGLREAGLDF